MQLYHWKARNPKDERETRPEGSCEYSGCGRPSYSWSSRPYSPKPATTVVIYLPRDRKNPYHEAQSYLACNVHAGLAKRSDVYGMTARFIKPIPENEEDIALIVERELRELRAQQDKNEREYREAVRERTPEERRSFLGPAVKTDGASLKDPDEYGLRYISVKGEGVGRYDRGLTPAEAESLAIKLLELAGEARRGAEA